MVAHRGAWGRWQCTNAKFRGVLRRVEPAGPWALGGKIGVAINAELFSVMATACATHETLLLGRGSNVLCEPRNRCMQPAQDRAIRGMTVPLVDIGQARPFLQTLMAGTDERRRVAKAAAALALTLARSAPPLGI